MNILKKLTFHRRCVYYQNHLGQIADPLLSLACQSEEEFLELGKRLQEFSSSSKEILQKTRDSLQQIARTDDDNVLVNIRQLFEEIITILNTQDKNIQCSLEQMKPITEKLNQLTNLQNDFQKISRSLRILGISIKVESHRAGVQGQEFMVLGEEIDHLWSNINQKTGGLFQQAAAAAKLMNGSQDLILSHAEKYHLLVRETQGSIQSAISEVEEMFRLSSETIERIGNFASEISREVSEVVFSLQSHDITRQQIEHVNHSLIKMSNSFKDCSPSPWSGFRPQPELDLKLQAVDHLLLVQVKQLENAVSEINEAGEKIRRSLTEIADKSEREQSEIAAFNETACNQKTGKMQALPREINKLALILQQCETMVEQISQVLQPATKSANQITECMREMEKVGYNINLLSLNALIKAAQNEEFGSGFDVLAEGIHQQANLSGELSRGARTELDNLIKSNKKLGENLKLIGEQKAKAESMIKQIMSNTSRLNSMNQEVSGLINLLMQRNSQLASQIKAVTSEIKFDLLFKTRIYEQVGRLKAIQKDLKTLLPRVIKSPDEEGNAQIESLVNQYTMEKERIIYRQAVSGLENESSDTGSSSTESSGTESSGAAENSNDDLGENIELF